MIPTNPEDYIGIHGGAEPQTLAQTVAEALQNWGAFSLDLLNSVAKHNLELAGRAGELSLSCAGRVANLAASLNKFNPLLSAVSLATEFDERLAPLDSEPYSDPDPNSFSKEWGTAA